MDNHIDKMRKTLNILVEGTDNWEAELKQWERQTGWMSPDIDSESNWEGYVKYLIDALPEYNYDKRSIAAMLNDGNWPGIPLSSFLAQDKIRKFLHSTRNFGVESTKLEQKFLTSLGPPPPDPRDEFTIARDKKERSDMADRMRDQKPLIDGEQWNAGEDENEFGMSWHWFTVDREVYDTAMNDEDTSAELSRNQDRDYWDGSTWHMISDDWQPDGDKDLKKQIFKMQHKAQGKEVGNETINITMYQGGSPVHQTLHGAFTHGVIAMWYGTVEMSEGW